MSVRMHAEALYDSLKSLWGSHDPDQILARLEKELRHIIPSWTDRPPDCPGWYWFKRRGISEPQLLLVDHGRIDTKLMADLGPPNNFVDVQRMNGLWAGPLLPPAQYDR